MPTRREVLSHLAVFGLGVYFGAAYGPDPARKRPLPAQVAAPVARATEVPTQAPDRATPVPRPASQVEAQVAPLYVPQTSRFNEEVFRTVLVGAGIPEQYLKAVREVPHRELRTKDDDGEFLRYLPDFNTAADLGFNPRARLGELNDLILDLSLSGSRVMEAEVLSMGRKGTTPRRQTWIWLPGEKSQVNVITAKRIDNQGSYTYSFQGSRFLLSTQNFGPRKIEKYSEWRQPQSIKPSSPNP